MYGTNSILYTRLALISYHLSNVICVQKLKLGSQGLGFIKLNENNEKMCYNKTLDFICANSDM